jgi:hypothetical protein
MKKRVVVWGTGVVGSMVVAEIVKHPVFELVGVGVTRSDRAGQDAGELCGLGPIGIIATTSVAELIALRPDALVHYGPTAQHADQNIRVMSAFLRAGIDVCSTAMTPWVWPHMLQSPANWIDPITAACEEGGASCFTTGIDPGFANDLFPLTLMGLCGEVRSVRASELLDYTDYEGDYEDEMGIGRSPEYTPLLEIPELLIMAWGATVPMIAHAAGIELDEITTTWEKWVTPEDRKTAKGVISAGDVAADRLRRRRLPRRHRGLTVDQPGDRLPVHRRLRPRTRRGRLPGHRPARAERRTRRQRPAARLGHRARPASGPGSRNHPLTGPSAGR